MTKANLAARAVALAVALAVWPAAVSAQTPQAIVRPMPAASEVGEGQIVAVAIQLENAQGAYGIDVRGRFDPAVVEIVGASASAPLSAGGFIKPDFVVVNTVDNQSGTFHWAATQINPAEPVTGTGPVVAFSLRGKASGRSSLIEVTAVELANANGLQLPVTLRSGSVAVVGPGAPAAGPTATSAAPTPAPTQRPLPENTPLPPVFATGAAPATLPAQPTATARPAATAPQVPTVVIQAVAPGIPDRASAAATPTAEFARPSPAIPAQALPAPTQTPLGVQRPGPAATPPPAPAAPQPASTVPTAAAALPPANANGASAALAPAAPVGAADPPAGLASKGAARESGPQRPPWEQAVVSAALIALGLLGWRLFSGAGRSA